MPLVRRVISLFVIAPLLLTPRAIVAQQYSTSTTVGMSLRVLTRASFEGGTQRPVSTVIVGGESLGVDPIDGVQTRMTFNAPTRVIVAGSPLVGPGGAIVAVRYVCAIGAGFSVSVSALFDCEGGTLAMHQRGGTSAVPIAVGAQLSARETLGMRPGVYAGRVTLTAVHPAY